MFSKTGKVHHIDHHRLSRDALRGSGYIDGSLAPFSHPYLIADRVPICILGWVPVKADDRPAITRRALGDGSLGRIIFQSIANIIDCLKSISPAIDGGKPEGIGGMGQQTGNLYDRTGKEVYRYRFSQWAYIHTIDPGTLPAGVYLVRLEIDGAVVHMDRVVVN